MPAAGGDGAIDYNNLIASQEGGDKEQSIIELDNIFNTENSSAPVENKGRKRSATTHDVRQGEPKNHCHCYLDRLAAQIGAVAQAASEPIQIIDGEVKFVRDAIRILKAEFDHEDINIRAKLISKWTVAPITAVPWVEAGSAYRAAVFEKEKNSWFKES